MASFRTAGTPPDPLSSNAGLLPDPELFRTAKMLPCAGAQTFRPRQRLSFDLGVEGFFQRLKASRGQDELSAAKIDKPQAAQASLNRNRQGAGPAAPEFAFPNH